MNKYSEQEFSDSGESVIDIDSGEKVVAQKTNKKEAYNKMLKWAEERRGFKFMSIPKQYKAFSLAVANKIDPPRLFDRWEEFENDKFWIKSGFDWMDVVLSFNKKK